MAAPTNNINPYTAALSTSISSLRAAAEELTKVEQGFSSSGERAKAQALVGIGHGLVAIAVAIAALDPEAGR